MDGKIITYCHVITEAIKPDKAEGAEVGVYFPPLRGREEKKREAVVEKFFPNHDDDTFLLQLKDEARPFAS